MNLAVSQPGRLAVSARWAGRVLSLVSLGLVGLFLMHDPPWPWRISTYEGLMLIGFPVGVAAGLILAWWREGSGVLVAVVGLAGFYLVHLLGSGGWPKGPWFLIFTSPAVFFLASWLSRRRSGGRA